MRSVYEEESLPKERRDEGLYEDASDRRGLSGASASAARATIRRGGCWWRSDLLALLCLPDVQRYTALTFTFTFTQQPVAGPPHAAAPRGQQRDRRSERRGASSNR